MKKLMILGASRGQVGLYLACKNMGVHSIAASIPGNYPGFALADETCEVDISNPDAVVKAARELGVDGIATCCMDIGVAAMGRACAELGLPGITEEAALDCASKLLLKDRLIKAGVPVAKYEIVDDPDGLQRAIGRFGLPIVIKAERSEGSSGVIVSSDADEIARFTNPIFEEGEQCLVEEYLEGVEFGSQACIQNGEVLFVLPHGDVTKTVQAPMPVGHYVPLDADQAIVERAKEVSEMAIHALSLDNCAVNIDIIASKGECYILELTGRAGANTLCELVSAYFGIDYYETVVKLALGMPVEFPSQIPEHGFILGQMLFVDEDATVVRACDEKLNDSVENFRLFVGEGESVRAFESLHDCVAQIVVEGETRESCEALVRKQFENGLVLG